MKKDTLILLNALGVLILLLIGCIIFVITNKNKSNNITKDNSASENQVKEDIPDVAKDMINFGNKMVKEERISASMATDKKLTLTLEELINTYGYQPIAECNNDTTSLELIFDDKGEVKSTYTVVDCLDGVTNEK